MGLIRSTDLFSSRGHDDMRVAVGILAEIPPTPKLVRGIDGILTSANRTTNEVVSMSATFAHHFLRLVMMMIRFKELLAYTAPGFA